MWNTRPPAPYDATGECIATGSDGSDGSAGDRGWTSATTHLEGGKPYYLYLSGLNTTVPIVTINRIEGKAEPEDELIELPEGSEDTARDCLDRTINDLTKTGTGEDAPLPDYVDTDSDGEESLRQAIEDGDPLTAEINGQTLDEKEVDPDILDAMNQQTEQELTNGEPIVFMELSVDLTLDGYGICQITELEEELEFIFSLTEAQQAQFRGKQVHVARCHGDGEVELIPCEFRDNGSKICFRTNKFSTFGLYASDAPASGSGSDQVVKTGDSRQPMLWALLLVSLGTAVSVLLLGKKRRS